MDTLETYIKMSDCPEIQKGWKRQLGDFAYNHHSTSNFHSGLNYGIPYIVTGRTWDKDIWLPRQDQLQEMIDWSCWQLTTSFAEFTHLEAGQMPTRFTSMEQLWLAFVMKEKFNKAWDGEKWIS